MRLHGLGDAVYVAVLGCWYLLLHLAFALVLLGFGAAVGLPFFLRNDPGLLLLHFMLFAAAQARRALQQTLPSLCPRPG